MKSARRAQASLEFLMTYGWVILIVLVVLVVLWQWGFFSFGQQVDPGSFGFWGVKVAQGNEFVLDESGQLQVSVLNTVGANITLLNYSASINGISEDCGTCMPYLVIEPGENKVVSLSSIAWGDRAGNRFDAYLSFQYNDTRTPGEKYQSSGRIWGNVEL